MLDIVKSNNNSECAAYKKDHSTLTFMGEYLTFMGEGSGLRKTRNRAGSSAKAEKRVD